MPTSVDHPAPPKRMSDAAVTLKTGRDWATWFALLDEAGAPAWNHRQIVTYLADHHKVPAWWCQAVAIAFEQERGLRAANEQSRGLTANRSKTMSAPAATLFDLIVDDRKRASWCTVPITIRTSTPYRSVRGRAQDDSRVEISVSTKDFARTQVVIQHSGLGSADLVVTFQQRWTDSLQRLDALATR